MSDGIEGTTISLAINACIKNARIENEEKIKKNMGQAI
jgi:hypothetical protein